MTTRTILKRIANVIQIIASFIGGTVVTAGILKATASNDILNNTSSNTNVINDHQIPEQQQPSTSTTSKFVVPSTSKSPLASILPVNVDTPTTLKP